MKKALFIVFAGLLLSGCVNMPTKTELNNSSWTLTAIGGNTINIAQPPTLIFNADKIYGITPVNNYTAAYTISRDTITISGMATTRKLSFSDELNQLENEFNDALTNAVHIELNGDELVIRGKRDLVFKRTALKKE